jgi:hypothetical protein
VSLKDEIREWQGAVLLFDVKPFSINQSELKV